MRISVSAVLSACRFVKQENLGPAICPGEWGGWAKEGGKDAEWQNKLADWFVENGITDSFYWCLNPNSGDTVRS
jgi:endoglucanase